MKRMSHWMTFLVILAVLAGSFSMQASSHVRTVDLQVLAISDWHAQLDPLNGVGGAAVLSAYFQQERDNNPNTLLFTAGDAYGASPPLSNYFDEIPAVLAMRMMGFDADTLGNHNFDRGIEHLQQMIDLANAPAGEVVGEPFQYVSANLRNRDANLDGVKDYEIFEVDGLKVAVIGITNPEAPTLVFPGSFGTIEVTDPVRAANKAISDARKEGAKFFIALIHAGITGFDPVTGEAFGPLIDFANNVGGFDLIIGDHTDFQYSGLHGKTLVVENRSKGATYSRISFTVDPRNGRVLSSSVEFVVPVASAVTPDPAIVAMLEPFRAELAPIFSTEIGSSSVEIPRSDSCGRADGRLCESLIGNVVTDSMRLRYSTDFAITNSGGIRSSLTCPTTDNPGDFCPPYSPPPFIITRGQVNTVLPFGNVVVTLDVTGEQLKAMLENAVSAMPGANGRFAQVSGLCFTYDVSAPVGSRVTSVVYQGEDGVCSEEAVDLSAASVYSVATNDFMVSGGDGYPVLISQAVSREIMDQVLADYISANSPLTPTLQGRITCTSSGDAVCPAPLP